MKSSQFIAISTALAASGAHARGRARSAIAAPTRRCAASTPRKKTTLQSVRWLRTSSGGTAASAL